jgi:hypothetical protein
MDVDMVSELKKEQVNFIVHKLKEIYFIDENMIIDAIEN